MAKTFVDLHSEDIFNSTEWKKYVKPFQKLLGDDIYDIFGDDYAAKLRFTHVFKDMADGNLSSALSSLKGAKARFVSETDQRIYARLVDYCENNAEMSKVVNGDWVKHYGSGYYLVLDRGSNVGVIKRAFDRDLKFVGDDPKYSHFTIKLTDLKTYQSVKKDELKQIDRFFKKHPEKKQKLLAKTDTFLAYREKLLAANLSEASYKTGSFYKQTSENTAFIVNLKDHGDRINVVYGFTSLAKYLNERETFQFFGEDSSDVTLRATLDIQDNEAENAASEAIKAFYDKYSTVSKDDLLAISKEKRKIFMSRINTFLKPLGFKKNGNSWKISLLPNGEDEYSAHIVLAKAWLDTYHIESYITTKDQLHCCFEKRIPDDHDVDWQLLTDNEIDTIMDTAVNELIKPIISTELILLGRSPDITKHCNCTRTACKKCWVNKNCRGK